MAWFRLPLVVPDRLMRRAPSTIGDQQRWGVQEVFEHLQLHPLKTFVPVAAGKMHVDEVDTDASLVQRLLAAQFPQWADLPLEPLEVDEVTWKRGRGWALSIGLIALPYYEHSNPTLAAVSRYAVREVLADSKFDR